MSIPDGYVPAPYPKHCYAKNPSDGSVITKVFASPEDHQFELEIGVKWFESPGEALRGRSDAQKPEPDTIPVPPVVVLEPVSLPKPAPKPTNTLK